MKNFYKILAVALLIGFAFGVSNVDAQSIKDRFNGIFVEHDADINGDLDVDGTSNLDIVDIDGAADFGAAITLNYGLILAPQSETVTATFELVPTSSYIVMTSSAAFTSSATSPITTTGATTGQLLILRNGNASDALIIDGTGGTVECKANVSLGASDTLSLIYNGAEWNCLSGYDNS